MTEQKRPALTLTLNNREELYRAYMPFLQRGGIFVPTQSLLPLGTSVLVLLTLLDQGERMAFPGDVAWVTPAGAGHKRQSGIGVHFAESDRNPRGKLEALLGGALNASRATETM